MLRLFNTKLSFGSESTAIKILYLIKDFHRDDQLGARYDSNNIVDKNFLISKLNEAIVEVIDYKKYKNLSVSEKENIRMAIARNLYLESDKYESSYDEEEEGGWSMTFIKYKAKGISFSMQFEKYPAVKAYEVNFPEALFTKKLLLKNCIRSALREFPNLSCSNENPQEYIAYCL